MNLVTCTTEVNPCPAGDQGLLSLSDALDPVSLGVDAQTILYVFSWGFAAVLAFFFIGYVTGAAIKVIKEL